MYGLDYTFLSGIKDTTERQIAYRERLKMDYLQEGFDKTLQRNNRDVIHIVEQSSSLIEDSIKSFNNALTAQVNELGCSLSNLEDSLINIEEELGNINSELNNISGLLDWGFNAIIENQRLNILLLTGIEELSKIPDREKERIMLIQRGIERQNEAFYNPKLYKNATKYYLEALGLYPEDPFVLNRLGFIHLYSKEDVDFEKAAKYFESAINFILPKYQTKKHLPDHAIYDTMPGLLAPQLFKDLRQQTVLSLFYAAQSNLLLNMADKSAGFLETALTILPDFQEARYLYIKTLLLLNKPKEEIEQLVVKMLDESPYYYFKFKKDIIFLQYPLVIQYADKYFLKLQGMTEKELNEIKSLIISNSCLESHFRFIDAAYRTNHFLGLLKARSLLKKEIKVYFNFCQYEA